MKGIIAAPGMALAAPYMIKEPVITVETRVITDVSAELERFRHAITYSHRALERLMSDMSGSVGSEEIEIFDFQLLMLEDTDFIGKMEEIVFERHVNCESAVKEVSEEYITYLTGLEDNAYLRERGADVSDLMQRLLRVLSGVPDETPEPDEEYIAVGVDIAPSRVASLNRKRLKGIILEKGGITSHCVILSRSLGIPCLIETPGIIAAVEQGAGTVLLDAISGLAVTDPDDKQKKTFEDFKSFSEAESAALEPYIRHATMTPDGFHMKVFANITTRSEADDLPEYGGEGVGLFRSELLFMSQNDAPPSEETQYQEYSETAKALGGRPLIIRTIDIGGDKQIGYMNIGKEDNPYLGYRAIRFCLGRPDVFKPQIAAVLRAGAAGNVQMMFPMITTLTEVYQAKRVVDQVKEELAARGDKFDPDMKLGIMIETPAAVFDARLLAKEVDFFSIGTNDLAQYLFAADRSNAMLTELNSVYQPVLLRAVHHAVSAAHEAGIEADICGQAAEADSLVPLWIAMGVDNLSVSMPRITAVRRRICNTNKAESDLLLDSVLRLETAAEVEQALSKFIEQRTYQCL